MLILIVYLLIIFAGEVAEKLQLECGVLKERLLTVTLRLTKHKSSKVISESFHFLSF